MGVGSDTILGFVRGESLGFTLTLPVKTTLPPYSGWPSSPSQNCGCGSWASALDLSLTKVTKGAGVRLPLGAGVTHGKIGVRMSLLYRALVPTCSGRSQPWSVSTL